MTTRLVLPQQIRRMRKWYSYIPESIKDAALHLDFINRRYYMIGGDGKLRLHPLSNIVTYTRTGPKTYWGQDGILQTAADNDWPDEYDPVTLQPIGKSVWGLRTNLLTYSSQFNDPAWTKTNVTVTPNAAVAPDGTLTMDKIVPTAANSSHGVRRSVTSTLTPHAWAIYAKAAEYSRVWVQSNTMPSGGGAYFDLSTQTISNITGGVSASIEHVGNDVYRCSIVGTLALATEQYSVFVINNAGAVTYTGDGASGIYIWGAQLEAGDSATSYIPTVATAISRSDDVATMSGAAFSDWYRQDEGTFVISVSFSSVSSTGQNTALAISDGSVAVSQNAGRRVGGSGAADFDYYVRDGADQVYVRNADTVTAAGVAHRMAFAYKLNDYAVSVDGGPPTTDTAATVPVVDRADLGRRPGGSYLLNGHLQRITYFPEALPDQVQALSS